MPCLSNDFNLATGPLISVGVAPANTLTPGMTSASQVVAFPALIDTGASATCVAHSLVVSVGLQPIGMRPVTSATHVAPTRIYLADLLLSFGSADIVLNALQVVEFNPRNHHFQMLLGRDVLCRGVFTMSFDGHFTFSL